MPRNILLFMTDQQRTDYVGYAADSCVSTPNIDWIAQHAHFTCCIQRQLCVSHISLGMQCR